MEIQIYARNLHKFIKNTDMGRLNGVVKYSNAKFFEIILERELKWNKIRSLPRTPMAEAV